MDLHIRQTLKEHRLFWALGISLLIHFAFLLFYTGWGRDIVFSFPEQESLIHRPPIAFEIIESRSNADSKPDRADFLSDRNAMASDEYPENLTQTNLPFSNGYTPDKNLTPAMQVASQQNQTFPQETAEGDRMSEEISPQSEVVRKGMAQSGFSREKLLASRSTPSDNPNRMAYKQQNSSAEDLGGLSFNTYAWEYAPYLLDLKRRIEKNIFPPPIYTRLGIGGSNVVRFRIMRDGQFTGPEVIHSEGEKSLISTSQNAVQYSAPFKPLPEDFPEPYLEVTARFNYIILNNP